MAIKSFQELLVWQKAHKLALEVYRVTNVFPKFELLNLVSQMRRCAVSVPSNIAEGFTRQTLKESLRFYNIADGSLEELKYQLILSKDLQYLKAEDYQKINSLAEEVGKLLNGWKKSQKF